MLNNVLNFPQLPDASQIKPVEAPKEVAPAAPSGKSSNDSDTSSSTGKDKSPPPYYQLRLTVDKDPNTGTWIYKAINRDTGEVVSELPQQSLLEMKNSQGYQAGSVITTQA